MNDELETILRRWAEVTDPEADPISGAEVRGLAGRPGASGIASLRPPDSAQGEESDAHGQGATGSGRRRLGAAALAAAVVLLAGTAVGLRALDGDYAVRVDTVDEPFVTDRTTVPVGPEEGRWPVCEGTEGSSPWPDRPDGPDVPPSPGSPSAMAGRVEASLEELEPGLARLVDGADHAPACLFTLGGRGGALVLVAGSGALGYDLVSVVAPAARKDHPIGISAVDDRVSVHFDATVCGAEESCDAVLSVRYGDEQQTVTEAADGEISLDLARNGAEPGAVTLTVRLHTGVLIEFRAFQVPPGDFAAS